MKPHPSLRRSLPFLRPALTSLLAFLFVSSAIGQTATGRITGVVTNRDGSAFLEGALVTLEGTNRATVTDRRGEFDFGALPSGSYTVSVTYTGMARATAAVSVAAGQTARPTVELREDAVKMGAFSVTADRSADALAVTEQQNAPNVKNVVDIQAYGMLNNDNPTELLQLLPGVTGSLFFNEADRVSIRGMSSSLNNVQLDGNSFATPSINGSTNSRDSILSTTNTNNIKSAEVIKAITPDRPADAIGGMVNLVQRSALDYPRSSPKFQYRLGGQYVQTRSGFDTRPTPNAQLTYHTVLGPQRNWGIFVTTGMHKEATNQLRTTQNIVANATFGPLPQTFQEIENDRFRARANLGVTIDHRRGGIHEFALKYKHDTWTEATESIISTVNGAVPATGWTPRVRSYSTGNRVVNHNKEFPFTRADSVSFEGKHRPANFEIGYNLFASKARLRNIRPSGRKEGTVDYGNVNSTLLTPFRAPLVVDDTRDLLFPSIRYFGPNAEAAFNPDNFSLTTTQNWQFRDDERNGARFDLKRSFDWRLRTSVKTGASYNEQSRLNTLDNIQRTFVGEDRVAGINPATGRSDDRISRFLNPNPPLNGLSDTGNRRPAMFNVPAVFRSFYDEPQLWTDDTYGNTLRGRQSNFEAVEKITAGYLMAETVWRRLSVLGGVRWEETKITGTGVFTNPVQATAAQIPDPVRRAINNAGTNFTRSSRYRNAFPSLHTVYRFEAGWQARASYSTGIGRPGYGAIVPNTTVNESAGIVTTSNPGLRPQFADSYDLSLEYYTEPAGIVSVGVFRKDIRDYIVGQIATVEPGFPLGDDYVGYELRTSVNGGSARVEGFEFNLVRQLNFIPRRTGLFTFKGNLTVLGAQGDFGTGLRLKSGQVPGFIPRAWNIIGEYTRGRFFMLARYNQQAGFPVGTTANPLLQASNPRREKIDVNLVYRWRPAAELFFAADNITERPSYQTLGVGERLYSNAVWAGSRRFNFGVQGKF
jgi:iron complex outermembrane receptor protein